MDATAAKLCEQAVDSLLINDTNFFIRIFWKTLDRRCRPEISSGFKAREGDGPHSVIPARVVTIESLNRLPR